MTSHNQFDSTIKSTCRPKISKRSYPCMDDQTPQYSPFSHIQPLPSPLNPAQEPLRPYHGEGSTMIPSRRSSGYDLAPFTSQPLSYPPPGAILTHPSFAQPQPQVISYSQTPQREFSFIFETGRKEPKSKKIKVPKDTKVPTSRQRPVLANKCFKDSNVALTRKAKPPSLNLKDSAKAFMMELDQTTYMPSPPPTAGLLRSRELPVVSDLPPYQTFGQPQNPYVSPRLTLSHRGGPEQPSSSYNYFTTSPLHDYRHESYDHQDSPPLPINAPVPRAPMQAYTPFFEDDLSFPDDDLDGEYEMEIEYNHQSNNAQEGVCHGLGLNLGEKKIEMMDFVPSKPSLALMMSSENDHQSTISRISETNSNLMGLGLSN
ncbi:uncharacterized protein I206_106428 [Kwoniella pini CBS 10737]|uniref:Uncharacterized protein n=1 Tax=Kwoniella pini CBS 10737 TaxID=1296096 RepID=A0A1B9HU98_9TREE|nr:uncharacterized protein I206_07232 [Kwoniella pini CBS 10737]OCF46845.1 hypothetical protein I206_07232 [Kwoniella pini CBS 10737]